MSVDSHKPLTVGAEAASLPFRDGLYASRAIRLMQLANEQRFPPDISIRDGTGTSSSSSGGGSGGSGSKEADGDGSVGERRPWFVAVGFSLPHEPLRFPKWAWDLYEEPDTLESARDAEGSEAAGNGFGGRVVNGSGAPVRKPFRLPVSSAPHPTRPLGSPIFALGDIKERFVYYDQGSAEQRRLTV
jgi:hypothetical protein